MSIDRLQYAHEELTKGLIEIRVALVLAEVHREERIEAGLTLAYELSARARDEIQILIDEYDPTPYCNRCGAMKMKNCDCGPIARNE